MENKKKLGFLSLLLAGALVFGACTPKKTTPSGSQEPSQPDSSQVESQGGESQPGSEVPSEPVEPSEPSVPVEPSEPSEPSTPVEPSEPSEPSTPVEPSEPSEPSEPEPSEPEESEEPSESEEQKVTVTFKVDDTVYDTQQINPGETVTAPAVDPTKAADENAVKYRFTGWDKDLTQPINEDTVVNALFAAYAAEIKIDDFEDYADSLEMADGGWVTRSWSNTLNDWDDNIGSTAVSLSTNARGGTKALRFDAWQNDVGYKFVRKISEDEEEKMSKSVNALQFSLMAPRIKTGGMKEAMLLINFKAMDLLNPATQQVQTYTPVVKYSLDLSTSEYVDYTIPLDDTGLRLWGEAGKSIAEVADWTGIHQDDIAQYISEIEFYFKGNNGGKKYIAFVDNLKLVTLDNPEKAEIEKMGQYTRYTGLLNNDQTVKLELGANGAATATVVDAETPTSVPGTISKEGKRITFTSADDGATLVYSGDVTDGGQLILFAEASGALAAAVQNVDLNAVQTVDNYDQYTEDGQAYCIPVRESQSGSGEPEAGYGLLLARGV